MANKKKLHHKWQILGLIVWKIRTCIAVLVVPPDAIAFNITFLQRISHFFFLHYNPAYWEKVRLDSSYDLARLR